MLFGIDMNGKICDLKCGISGDKRDIETHITETKDLVLKSLKK